MSRPPSSPYLTIAQYAEHCQVSQRTIFRWLNAGLPHQQKGRVIRIDPSLADLWWER